MYRRHLLAISSPTHLGSRASEASDVSSSIRTNWVNPSDTLSILSVIGGDVILKALAQLAGLKIVPVAFSFGWVAYSFNTLMSVFGNGRMMPEPDYPAKVFNIASGIHRESRSWVIGRFLRDMEKPLEDGISMSLSVYRVVSSHAPSLDWCYYSGIFTIILQLGLAAIPWGMRGDYSIFLVTASGTVLALITGSLPQWYLEKYPGRRHHEKVVAITGGNGSRHIVLIIDMKRGIDLEDLAAAQPLVLLHGTQRTMFGIPVELRVTQIAYIILTISWIFLLITVNALSLNAWYLLLVGGIGMLQNVFVAGAQRTPGANGIHLEKVEDIKRKKVMHALMDTEKNYPKAGKALLGEFFSEDYLQSAEVKWWRGERRPYDDNRDSKPGSVIKDLNANPRTVNLARKEYNSIINPE